MNYSSSTFKPCIIHNLLILLLLLSFMILSACDTMPSQPNPASVESHSIPNTPEHTFSTTSVSSSHGQKRLSAIPSPVGTTALPLKPHSSYRYTDNNNGTVTDNRSGLIWLKKANCFGWKNNTWSKAKERIAKLADGQCELSDDSKPGMWRLPSKEEWQAMIDKQYVDTKKWNKAAISNATATGPWKAGDAFLGVKASYYWSSTTNVYNSQYAWYVSLDYGYLNSNNKTYTYYVWPVRDGQ